MGDGGVEADDKFFAARLDLVPLEMMLPKEDVEDDAWMQSKFGKNLKRNAPKQVVKESSKRAQKRRKRYVVDEEMPSNAELLADHARAKAAKEAKPEVDKLEAEARRAALQVKPARNIEELKQRLADKIKNSETSRGGLSGAEKDKARAERRGDTKALPGSKAAKAAEGDKKKELKAAKAAARAKGREERANAKAAKAASKAVRAAKAADAATKAAATATPKGEGKNGDDQAHEAALREKVAESILKGPKLSFGAIEGADVEVAETNKKRTSYTLNMEQKKGPGKRNPLNVKRMLKQAEENRALIDELKKSSNPEDRRLAEEKQWDKVERKAMGERVAEPKHLKKALKRIERKKQKSAKEWADRLHNVEKAKTERYDKRDANIASAQQKKVEAKLKRKGIVLDQDKDKPKRPRLRPGFEGKHAGFLNDDGDAKAGGRKGGKGKAKGGDAKAKAGDAKGRGKGKSDKPSKAG